MPSSDRFSHRAVCLQVPTGTGVDDTRICEPKQARKAQADVAYTMPSQEMIKSV